MYRISCYKERHVKYNAYDSQTAKTNYCQLFVWSNEFYRGHPGRWLCYIVKTTLVNPLLINNQ